MKRKTHKNKSAVWAVLLSVLFVMTACGSKADPAGMSAPEALSYYIKENHPNPFTKVSEEEFDALTAETDQLWEGLSTEEDAAYYEVRRLAAKLGDEHTSVAMPAGVSQPELPFFVMVYDGQWMIVQAQSEYSALVGKQLLAVNGVDIQQLRELLLPLISYETEQWGERMCSLELRYLRTLRYLGVADSLDSVNVTFADAATREQSTMEVKALTQGYDYQNSVLYPLAQTLGQSGYYYANLISDGTVFIQYNMCADNPDMPMKQFADTLAAQLENPPQKIIVDLRHNTGGDSRVITPLLKLLEKLSGQGSRLYCLIGADTFSSGVMNALDLKEIGACLVGQPTGGVLGFGELKAFSLPDGSTLYCSTKDFSEFYELDGALEPDIEVVQTVEDFLNGIDSVVAYIEGK